LSDARGSSNTNNSAVPVEVDATMTTSTGGRPIEMKEVAAVRALLRKQKYLSIPLVDTDHKSVNGEVSLSANLRYFTATAMERTKTYITGYQAGETVNMVPVYVTDTEKAESEAITNLTKEQLKNKIVEHLAHLDDSNVLEDKFERTVKGKTRAVYQDFFQELLEKISETTTDSLGESDP
jgi:hypothetical protein